jgi:hypothetical protein
VSDDLTLDEGTGSKKAATDEVSANRHIPWVKVADGSDNGTVGAAVDSSGHLQVDTNNPSIVGTAGTPNSSVLSVQGVSGGTVIPVQGQQAALQTGNITSSSSTVGPFVATQYNIATVTVHGTYAGVNFGFWGSDDGGTTWYPLQGVRTDSFFAESTSGVLTSNTSRAWDIPVGAFTHFKVVSTAWTSGTAIIGVGMQSMPYEPSPTVGLAAIAGTAPDVNTGAATAGTLRAVLATRHETAGTPVAARLASSGAAFDATASGADGATVPRRTLSTRHEAAATPLAARISQDGTNFMSSTYPVWVQEVPTAVAANSLSTFQPSSGNIVAGNIKASAGSLYGLMVMNQVAGITWIQFFNTTGTPTLGTSVIFALPVPGGAGTGLLIMMPGDFAIANFATGISWGAATAVNGASAPATAPQGVCFYK